MKKLSVYLVVPLVLSTFAPLHADSILIDSTRGSVIKLTEKGQPACGTVNWGSIRRSGSTQIDGYHIDMKEAKFPLEKGQWQQLLSKIAGDKEEVTIAHDWKKGPAGLAAALRVAYDIRSHGGKAWVFNGPIGKLKPASTCVGQYVFKDKPEKIYMDEAQFWAVMKNGHFLDARGRGATAPPSYTWVMGSPLRGKAVDIASFINNEGKVDKDAFGCEVFKDISVAGCDSVHKTFLAVEAAKYANCASQPKIMPYWGLAGASRHSKVAEKLWGSDLSPNSKRSGEIAK